tara:strand:- start:51 stop:164 length:114 start_codon:yes stop_codon:yes gene_type:complete
MDLVDGQLLALVVVVEVLEMMVNQPFLVHQELVLLVL